MENPLIRELTNAIARAQTLAVRCPRCLKVITNQHTIRVTPIGVMYHVHCKPLG